MGQVQTKLLSIFGDFFLYHVCNFGREIPEHILKPFRLHKHNRPLLFVIIHKLRQALYDIVDMIRNLLQETRYSSEI